jgi:hypothetical protein
MNVRLMIRAATATLLAGATAYGLWRVEWFDVFRWGVPGPDLLVVYAVYVGASAAAGWYLPALFIALFSEDASTSSR